VRQGQAAGRFVGGHTEAKVEEDATGIQSSLQARPYLDRQLQGNVDPELELHVFLHSSVGFGLVPKSGDNRKDAEGGEAPSLQEFFSRSVDKWKYVEPFYELFGKTARMDDSRGQESLSPVLPTSTPVCHITPETPDTKKS
jgi:hypothetical protein